MNEVYYYGYHRISYVEQPISFCLVHRTMLIYIYISTIVSCFIVTISLSLSLSLSLSIAMYPSKPVESTPPVTGTSPNMDHVQSQAPVVWSAGLCDCMDDVENCCLTCWCPCITFGRIAEIVDRGSTSCGTAGALYVILKILTRCHWIYSWSYRSKLRLQYNLPESPCCDCCVHFCCNCCALCQEYIELKNRGYDMTIGWQMNMEKRSQGTTQPPVMQGDMIR